jgi:glycosyltransferase involved in cell wall biosynthesis
MLLVCDSHPVQYRAPIYQELARRMPNNIHVVYASDCSVRGYRDAGFGESVAWDEPMLEGYSNSILNSERGLPLSGWGSLTGRGLQSEIRGNQPKVALLTGLNYRYDWAASRITKLARIPLWLRCETQDEAIGRRTAWKSYARSLIYRGAYRLFDRFFFIGELNREHYLRHGVVESRLRAARYFTVDRASALTEAQKQEKRREMREAAGIAPGQVVCGFSGKLIPKKDPALLFAMLAHLPQNLLSRLHLYFVGSGELQGELQSAAEAARLEFGVKTHFAGFVNQSAVTDHYLAMDVLVLPSRRMGETWGLVANEAMQAGCSVVVSDAVGCARDFASWGRFRVFPEQDARALAGMVAELADQDRTFSWAADGLAKAYSLERTVDALQQELAKL